MQIAVGRFAGAALVANNIVGLIVGVRRGVAPLPFGLRSPVRGRLEPVVWGTGLSAPVPMIVGLGVATWRRRSTFLGALAATNLVGMVAEPITWRRHRPPLVTAVVAAHVVLPCVVIATTFGSSILHRARRTTPQERLADSSATFSSCRR